MLSELPLEIIDEIFAYLQLADKLNLAQVSQQFGSAFAYNARDEYKDLLCSKYSDAELEIILPLCGHTVDHVNVNRNLPKSICELIPQYCIKLESATLYVDKVNGHKEILKMNGLRKIELTSVEPCHESDVLDYIQPECKVLVIWDISMAQAQSIRKLINLEELQIFTFLNGIDIFEICSHLKNLRALKISRPALSKTQKNFVYPELEELKIVLSKIYTYLPTCPKLKSLNLALNVYRNNIQLNNIITKYAGTLERLGIEIEPEEFQAFNLIDVLKECKKVQYLDIEMAYLHDLFRKKLDSFIEVLKENGFNPQRLFKLDSAESFHKLMQEFANSEVWNLVEPNLEPRYYPGL